MQSKNTLSPTETSAIIQFNFCAEDLENVLHRIKGIDCPYIERLEHLILS